jgi:hypothetical protein
MWGRRGQDQKASSEACGNVLEIKLPHQARAARSQLGDKGDKRNVVSRTVRRGFLGSCADFGKGGGAVQKRGNKRRTEY